MKRTEHKQTRTIKKPVVLFRLNSKRCALRWKMTLKRCIQICWRSLFSICYLSYQSRDVLDFIWFGWKRSKTDVMVMVMHRWIRWSSLFSLEERICLCIKQDGIWLIGAFRSESDRILVDPFRGQSIWSFVVSRDVLDFIWFGDKFDGDIMPEEKDDRSNHLELELEEGVCSDWEDLCACFSPQYHWRHQHFLLILIY